jgi:RHS repeat-associated protein
MPETYYYHQGYNHDVDAITNALGKVVERYMVKPYGEFTVSTDGIDGVPGTADDVRYTQSTIGNNIVFQGRPFDAATGLYDFRNRRYSPTLGRFISRDPMRYNAGDLNLYRFVGNSPMDVLDPMGLFCVKLWESRQWGQFHGLYYRTEKRNVIVDVRAVHGEDDGDLFSFNAYRLFYVYKRGLITTTTEFCCETNKCGEKTCQTKTNKETTVEDFYELANWPLTFDGLSPTPEYRGD